MRAPWAASLVCLLAGCQGAAEDHFLPTPPQGLGFQFEAPPFDVLPGTETQRCFFVSIPGAPGADVWVRRFELAGSIGSHHVNLFRVKTELALKGQPGEVVTDGECWKAPNWGDWPLVVNSQDDGTTVDWELPTDVGARFQGGEKLMLQVHYVNATTQKTPGKARAAVNLHTVTSPPKHELGTIFATNKAVRFCPGQSATFETHCTNPFDREIKVVAANGHFHSRGIKFEMMSADASGAMGSAFYESLSWSEPPMARGLDLGMAAGTSIGWRCEYEAAPTDCGNPDDQCCFSFGGKVETQEHCNAFVYYYPRIPDYNCF